VGRGCEGGGLGFLGVLVRGPPPDASGGPANYVVATTTHT